MHYLIKYVFLPFFSYLPIGFLLNHNLQLDKWVICSIYQNLSASERESRKRKATVLSERLDTTGKKREIVLQQGPLNGYQENDLSMVPLFDNLPEERIPYDQSIVLYEGLNTKGKKREIIFATNTPQWKPRK